ncbi:uncharacterized protein LOC119078140 [Bradysia coprophila]|uniref:uncharacterized protein LOC119078140 n=1 Tax=Bradysia coprophila TaxID=38358 RepID=UPI00187D89D6|nr:uncharacterized protein LOC119078140 [Bradysia coprophila]
MICLRLHFLYQLLVILASIYLTLGLPAIHHKNDGHRRNNAIVQHNHDKDQNKELDRRIKRQLDFNLSVDHEDDTGTDITAALEANIWKSVDGRSRLDGNAKYQQHIDEFGQNGEKYRVGIKLIFEV